MGAIHLSQSQGPKPSNATVSFTLEWAMNNFSSGFPTQGRKEYDNESFGKDREKQGDHKPEAARCEWDFSLATVVSSGANAAVSDSLGVIEFDPSNTVVATGGIARKIRIYDLKSLLPQDDIIVCNGEQNDIALLDHVNACSYYICTPAKLSSLRWKPGSGGRLLGSGDYDGVVTEYDLERKLPVFERDEHGGRIVWSVDYSHRDTFIGASGSDDGTMQMWDQRCGSGECVAKVQPSTARSSVCCVEFSPSNDYLLAVGCADKKAYAYDVRKMDEPLHVLGGHTKTVTYVRFLDTQTMVSAGTDGCLKLWNISDCRLIRTYKGHKNCRSFVGLSVWRHGGLLGCGSENNKVFVYDKRWGEPIWVRCFETMAGAGFEHGFVNSVCWRQVQEDRCTLLAGGSNGILQVFVGTKKS
ncbi:WD repeat-containing protein RUP2 [Hibiscus syriacus]|uniref:WD repeat-containing protein RUP2 n=1 Tax=Hibiscus syriacus TaxID=106335 RepID=A0A6A2YQ67_HIBSY|nr:WD repeat-containing protein RUP2-like [Hibiscus syriacus]KAE8681518.1 WD repeat-containing protein RUP2 [Hibiscus syriacus]